MFHLKRVLKTGTPTRIDQHAQTGMTLPFLEVRGSNAVYALRRRSEGKRVNEIALGMGGQAIEQRS